MRRKRRKKNGETGCVPREEEKGMRERVIGGRGRVVGMGEEVKCSRERERGAGGGERWRCGQHTMVCAERVREDGRRKSRNEEVLE